MKRNRDLYEESLPVFYYQRRELREQLEELNQQKIGNTKIFLPKVEKKWKFILPVILFDLSLNHQTRDKQIKQKPKWKNQFLP